MKHPNCMLFLIFALALCAGVPARAASAPSPMQSATRSIQFCGFSWLVKRSAPAKRVGPGPNFFSDDPASVFVDANGSLHLTIRKVNGQWLCSEVILQMPGGLKYGTYRFTVRNTSGLDPNVVLGLFTWSDASGRGANFHSEIDVEVSRWTAPGNADAQYVCQPYTLQGHIQRWQTPPNVSVMVHGFTWSKGSIDFQSFSSGDTTSSPFKEWVFSGQDVPVPGPQNVRINLWCCDPRGPANGKDAEVVIDRFEFSPAQPAPVVEPGASKPSF